MAGQTLKNLIPKLQIYKPLKDVFDALFINPIYYSSYGPIGSIDLRDEKTRTECSRALLYLHTLPFQYSKLKTGDIHSFFNNKTERGTETAHGGLEIVPYGFLVFLGGLIWRKRWYSTMNYDPFLLDRFSEYKPTESGYDPLLVRIGNDVRFCLIPSTASNVTYLKYSDIVNDDMDVYTENTLLNLFTDFVTKVFVKKIMPLCELKYKEVIPEDTADSIAEDDDDGYDDDTSETEPTYPSIENQNSTFQEYVFDSDKMTELRDDLNRTRYSIGGMLEILTGTTYFKEDEDGTQYYVSNFAPNYSMGFYCDTDDSFKLYFSEENEIHEYFTQLYDNNSIAIRTGYNSRSSTESYRKITDSVFKSYLTGLCNVLESKRSYDARNNTLVARTNETERLSDRDLKCAIYIELKNLWDRWFCGYYNQDRDYFNVKEKTKDTQWQNTLFGNFVFIDSFYNDISYKLRLNCNTLLSFIQSDTRYESKGGSKRVSTHLGNVVSAHKCMMYNFPDYVGFDGNAEHAIDMMENLFKPLPVSKVEEPKLMNKFVIIYATFAQRLNSKDRNDFNNDSFNIYSYKDGTEVAPVAFSKKKLFAGQGTGQMGYIVPSFCVEYSRQNNSYWTNIGINTTSHANTEVGAMAEATIAEKGNSSKRQICFYGQDVYPIYQAYSYMVTIEMLGNAQIQPLMYFQLLNVPMFTGAYMVINVEHTITPGMMKTTVTGMRMTKVQPPFTKAWFTITDEGKASPDPGYDFAGNGEEILSNNNTVLDIADNNLSKAINDNFTDAPMRCDEFVRAVYGNENIGVEIENNLAKNEDGIDMLSELESKKNEWEVHEFRRTSRPSKKNNWSPLYATSEKQRIHPVCGDLLFGYHDNENYDETKTFHHVSIYLGLAAKDSSDIYVAEGTSVGGNKIQDNNGKVQVCSIQDSRMGLDSDVITHWAHCKKYEVRQDISDGDNGFPYRIVPSNVISDVSDSPAPDRTETITVPMLYAGIQTQPNGNIFPEYSLEHITTVPQTQQTDNQTQASSDSTTPKQSNTAPQPQFEPTPENKEWLYTIEDLNPNKVDMKKVSDKIKNNLTNLIKEVLDPVTRMCIERYGTTDPIMAKQPHINSGYRTKKKNDDTPGASTTSQHMVGEAADIDYYNGSQKPEHGLPNLKFAREVVRRGIWDQLIIESPVKFNPNDLNPNHVDLRCAFTHVSYSTKRMRNKITVCYKQDCYYNLTKEQFLNFYRVVVPDDQD